MYKKEIASLKSSTTPASGGENNDSVLLQKESEVLKLKLEIKEQGEEYTKLEEEAENLKKQNEKLISEHTAKLKKEQENYK